MFTKYLASTRALLYNKHAIGNCEPQNWVQNHVEKEDVNKISCFLSQSLWKKLAKIKIMINLNPFMR